MGIGMWRVPFKCGPAFWSDKTRGDVSALVVRAYRHLFLNGSRRQCLSSGSLTAAKIQPSFILDTQYLHFFTLPGLFSAVPRGDLRVASSISNFSLIIYIGDKLFLANCLGSLRDTWFVTAFHSSSNILVARQLPTSALPVLALRWAELHSHIWSDIAFNVHMLALLPHEFSNPKNINISHNPAKTHVAFFKSWALTSQNGHNPGSGMYYQCDLWASFLSSPESHFPRLWNGENTAFLTGLQLHRTMYVKASAEAPSQSRCSQLSGIYLFWKQSVSIISG